MTIQSAMQSAAIRLMGQKPSAFFSATDKFAIELCDLVNEVATDIAKYQDWQPLIQFATVTGNGTATDFPLPLDYDRMLQNASVNDRNNWFWGFDHTSDISGFAQFQNFGFQPLPGIWTIYGNRLRFSPAPSASQIAQFPYISKNWAIDTSTAPKSAFTADTDSFALPERLLTLGLVWRWRENKKLDATGDEEAFIKALDEYAAKDKGARVYRRGSRRSFPGTYAAWPWALGPSTYIDS